MKAVITDLDRTLLHTDKSVSDDTVKVLKSCREKGILLVAATARPERAITQYQEKIGFDVLITLNGARTVFHSKELNYSIPKKSVLQMLQKLEDIEGVIVSLETEDGIFSNVDIPQWQPTVFEKLSEAPLPDVFYKIIVSSNELDLHEYMDQILTDDTYASVADGVLFQIMSKQATKWNGIRAALDSLGISPEEAVFFGDDNDDIESLKNCGIGAAVSNAIKSAKEAADIIIKSNDEDGVAEFLKKKLLRIKNGILR
ncbi:MAG: HAD family hydrolase [Clostridiales bacterium]|nr:HAD family hydrolase [Candidatus Blautia equi]